MLSFAAICPHPPIIIPTIGQKKDLLKTKETIEAMENLRTSLEKKDPEVLIVISPHGPVGFKELAIVDSKSFTGNFSIFGDQKTKLTFKGEEKTKKELIKALKKENLLFRTYEKEELDHGTLVPLFFLTKNIAPNILPLGYSLLSLAWNFKYGNILGEVIQKSKKKIGIIASGDLSHCLTPEAPAGYSPLGEKFDKKLLDSLKNNDIKEILNIEESLAEEAGECGLRSIAILLGVLSTLEKKWAFEILCYQSPFGVGYLTANIKL